MSFQIKTSWIEQFMNWYPLNTSFCFRKVKNENNFGYEKKLELTMKRFQELKPFFERMEKSIRKDERRIIIEKLCQEHIHEDDLIKWLENKE